MSDLDEPKIKVGELEGKSVFVDRETSESPKKKKPNDTTRKEVE